MFSKSLVSILVMIFSSLAHAAEWRLVGENSATAFYFDKSSIKKVDGYIYYWSLVDVKSLDTEWKSALAYRKADCDIDRYQMLTLAFYEGSMGKGEQLGSDEISPEWSYMLPDSIDLLAHNNVCDLADMLVD